MLLAEIERPAASRAGHEPRRAQAYAGEFVPEVAVRTGDDQGGDAAHLTLLPGRLSSRTFFVVPERSPEHHNGTTAYRHRSDTTSSGRVLHSCAYVVV